MSASRWSNDQFLNKLAGDSDALADATVAKLEEQGGVSAVSRIFQIMRSNRDSLPEDAPPPLVEFFDATNGLGPNVDLARLRRGEAIYLRHSFTAALVLLAKSLPEGYSAPNLTEILNISGNLGHHPYRRLLGVLQLVVNVSSTRGFENSGSAIITAQKMRLLHAGVRRITREKLPGYASKYGVPVNHEDMLGTLMGFSYLVIEGLRILNVGLLDEEAEDLYYVWRVFGRAVGIAPADDPTSFEYLPEDLDECAQFYRSYVRRHYRNSSENPIGVALAQANLSMIQDLLSRHVHLPGVSGLARLYMLRLMGIEGAARVGIKARSGSLLSLLGNHLVPHLLQGIMSLLPGHAAERLSKLVFQGLILHTDKGQVEFLLPENVEDLRNLA